MGKVADDLEAQGHTRDREAWSGRRDWSARSSGLARPCSLSCPCVHALLHTDEGSLVIPIMAIPGGPGPPKRHCCPLLGS